MSDGEIQKVLFALEPSMVVPVNKNRVPENGVKLYFKTGALTSVECSVSNLNDFWKLIGFYYQYSDEFL